MVAYLRDRANCVTLCGLFLALGGLFAAMNGVIWLTLALLLWAVLCDHADGEVARRMTGRDAMAARVGADLDSLIDLVHGAMVPSVLVLKISSVSLLAAIASVALMSAAALRLAVYNNIGLTANGRFLGVPVTMNAPLLTLVFLANWMTGELVPMPTALSVMLLVLAAAHISSLSPPSIRSRSGVLSYGLLTVMLSGLLVYVRLSAGAQ